MSAPGMPEDLSGGQDDEPLNARTAHLRRAKPSDVRMPLLRPGRGISRFAVSRPASSKLRSHLRVRIWIADSVGHDRLNLPEAACRVRG